MFGLLKLLFRWWKPLNFCLCLEHPCWWVLCYLVEHHSSWITDQNFQIEVKFPFGPSDKPSKRRAVHIVLLVLIPSGQQNRPHFSYNLFIVVCLPSDSGPRTFPLAILRISSRSQKEKRVPTLVGWGISPARTQAQTVETLHPRMRATSLTRIRGQRVSEKFSGPMWILPREVSRGRDVSLGGEGVKILSIKNNNLLDSFFHKKVSHNSRQQILLGSWSLHGAWWLVDLEGRVGSWMNARIIPSEYHLMDVYLSVY